jgi:hypothetical protein
MTTSDIVMERALALATDGTQTEEAVRDLLATAEGRRVSVVLARQHLVERDDADAARAVELLDQVLGRLPKV